MIQDRLEAVSVSDDPSHQRKTVGNNNENREQKFPFNSCQHVQVSNREEEKVQAG